MVENWLFAQTMQGVQAKFNFTYKEMSRRQFYSSSFMKIVWDISEI